MWIQKVPFKIKRSFHELNRIPDYENILKANKGVGRDKTNLFIKYSLIHAEFNIRQIQIHVCLFHDRSISRMLSATMTMEIQRNTELTESYIK